MSQRKDYEAFADGLTAWIRGEDSDRAEAAAQLVAATITAYLNKHTKEE